MFMDRIVTSRADFQQGMESPSKFKMNIAFYYLISQATFPNRYLAFILYVYVAFKVKVQYW